MQALLFILVCLASVSSVRATSGPEDVLPEDTAVVTSFVIHLTDSLNALVKHRPSCERSSITTIVPSLIARCGISNPV